MTTTTNTTKLQKSIEVSTRRIGEFQRKADKYAEAFNKANKFGFNLNELITDNTMNWRARDIVNNDIEKTWYNKLKDELGENNCFDVYCKLTHNANYYVQNIVDGKDEQEHLNQLNNELAQINATIAKQDDERNNPNGLRKVLVDILAEFKTEWFNKMREWHSQSYDNIWANKPMWVKWIERKDRLTCRYYKQLNPYNGTHNKIRKALDEKEKRYRKHLSSRELTLRNKDEYMRDTERELVRTWNHGLDVFVEKCNGYDVDASKVEVHSPRVTFRGFEAVLTDGKPRVVDIRSIWAAEFSPFVTPHTRYIVTQRKVKK